MGIFIETPGVLTTVQDGGRYGYEQFGVSPSGPMDLELWTPEPLPLPISWWATHGT